MIIVATIYDNRFTTPHAMSACPSISLTTCNVRMPLYLSHHMQCPHAPLSLSPHAMSACPSISLTTCNVRMPLYLSHHIQCFLLRSWPISFSSFNRVSVEEESFNGHLLRGIIDQIFYTIFSRTHRHDAPDYFDQIDVNRLRCSYIARAVFTIYKK